MVVLVTYNLMEAQVAAGRLKTEGIPAMVVPVAGANAMGLHVGVMGEVKVLVHPTHYEQALVILEPEESGAPELPDNTDYVLFDDDDGDDDE